tara:strand:- start:226 stop:579 length:354 start_codon:yes stop_codon:yes gene_type:complete
MLNPDESNSILIDYDFISKVLQDFNNTGFEIEEVKQKESIYSHIFSFSKEHFELFLNKKMDAISLEGDWQKTIGFVISFINHLPESQKVHFFDDSYNDNMVIDFKTNREDIESVFSY